MKTILLFLGLYLLHACSTYPCIKNPGLQINFISFSEADIQPFFLYRYQKGSNFQNRLDSIKVDSTVARYQKRGDTLYMGATSIEVILSSQFDYRIELPATNTRYDITEIVEEIATERKSWLNHKKDICVNPITSCNINGIKNEVTWLDLFLKK